MHVIVSRFRLGLAACFLVLAAASTAASDSQPIETKDGAAVLAPAALPLRYGVEDLGKPAIHITEWQCDFDGSLIKIAWAAQSNRANIAIGSFGIRVLQCPEGFEIPGTFTREDPRYGALRYFRNPEGTPAGGFPDTLLDNGALDLDKREGRFAVNIDTKGYEPGNYEFNVFVHNRPAKGAYVSDVRAIAFTISANGRLLAIAPRPALSGAEHAILYMKEGVYSSFPSLAARPDGKWIVSFGTRTTRDHINPDGGSRTLLSDDEGRTWIPTNDRLVDRMSLTQDGTKLVAAQAAGWVYVPDTERARLTTEMRVVRSVKQGQIAYLGGAIKKVSTDGGKTWATAKIDIPEDISGLLNHHYSAMAMTTKEGVRLTAVYGKRIITGADGKKKHGNDEVFILRSEDDGETWSFIPVLPQAPDLEKKELGFNETAVAQAGDGSVFLMMRSLPESNLWISHSTDLGKTWSTPADSGLKGYPADMITLADGRVLCVYGYRYAPLGIRAAITADGGRTWSDPIALRDDGAGMTSDLGYPMSLQRADGKIFTVYYLTTADAADTHIAATVWDPPAVAP